MRKKKTDKNQIEIVEVFKKCGMKVEDLSGVGGGMSDIEIYFEHLSVKVEIKDGSLSPSKRKLRGVNPKTPNSRTQIQFHSEYTPPITVIESVEQAVALSLLIKERVKLIPSFDWNMGAIANAE